jgi:hypothetical protein
MSKFFQNLLVQISKALVYSKIKFYSEKNFPRHFRPIRPFGPVSFFYRLIFSPLPTGPRPSSRPSPLARPNWPPFFFLPHQSRAHTVPPPTGLAPPPRSPRRLHQKRKMAASNPPSFPPIIRLHSPFNPAIEAPSSQKLRALGPPPPRLRPVKADPSHGEASHTSNDPSPSPHRALTVVLLSQGFRHR